jgi:hypothetical protein
MESESAEAIKETGIVAELGIVAIPIRGTVAKIGKINFLVILIDAY